jgi:hypothetical protein
MYELANEDIIVFHRSEKGYRPIQAKRMDWRKYPILVKRQSLPPPTVRPLPSLPDIALQEPAAPTPDNVVPLTLDDPDTIATPDARFHWRPPKQLQHE